MAIKIQHANERDYKKTMMLIEISVQTSYTERCTSTEQPDSPVAVLVWTLTCVLPKQALLVKPKIIHRTVRQFPFLDVSLLAYKYTPVPHHFLNLLINLHECLRVKDVCPSAS